MAAGVTAGVWKLGQKMGDITVYRSLKTFLNIKYPSNGIHRMPIIGPPCYIHLRWRWCVESYLFLKYEANQKRYSNACICDLNHNFCRSKIDEKERERKTKRWKMAVERSLGWDLEAMSTDD